MDADVNLIYFTVAGDSEHGLLFLPDRELSRGDGPFLANSSGTLPGGLAIQTPYWVIRRGQFMQLATSEVFARGGLALRVTSSGSGLHLLVRAAGLSVAGQA